MNAPFTLTIQAATTEYLSGIQARLPPHAPAPARRRRRTRHGRRMGDNETGVSQGRPKG